MSNTRRTNTPGIIKQERFASSQEYERGLMANLVAKRCSVLERAEDRELIWALQLLSHRPGGLKKLTSDLMASFPERIATDSMRKFDMKPGQIYTAEQVRIVREEIGGRAFPLKGEIDIERAGMGVFLEDSAERRANLQREARLFPSNYPAADFVKCCREAAAAGLEKHLLTLCLDPALPVADGSPWYFPALLSALREFLAGRLGSHCRQTVVTSLSERVHEALDYTSQTGSMSLIEGQARFGKSHSAKDWCERHPGRARYVQLESSRDEMSFFRTIAKALGVSINLNSKAQELRQRIEDTLQGGDLVIVVDEAHYLWPNMIDSRTLPARINWILTALVNNSVPVALVTTPQFLRNQKEFETRTRWTSEQLTGRIGHYEPLPVALTPEDLHKVAAALLPDASEQTLEALVVYAQASTKYLAGIRHAVDRAGFIAGKDGRDKIQFSDVKRALKEAVIPSDTAFAKAIGQTTNPARKRAANVFATPMQRGFSTPEIPLPVERIPSRGVRPAMPSETRKPEFAHA
jgi:hypothetical protein